MAKCPSSILQILGAEKALSRALKTRGNTTKYGLIFHSSFIGSASARNKGRMARYLANKCSIASCIVCFLEDEPATHINGDAKDEPKSEKKKKEKRKMEQEEHEVKNDANGEDATAKKKKKKSKDVMIVDGVVDEGKKKKKKKSRNDMSE